ncbi:MAG: conjugal transfer protein TraF [Marinomonas foliarum]|uniref:conjugal transfer protein TraF n=1 Tax=Marinomonas foliarum TaxID=491950 RepID=UPI003F950109
MRYLVLFLVVISINVAASVPVYVPIGSNTSLGGYANRQSLETSLSNPAASYLMTPINNFRVGFLGPLDFGLEIGDVKGIEDKASDLGDKLEADYSTEAEINAALVEVNASLASLESDAYVKVYGSLQAPFAPIIYKTRNRGAFSIDASASFVSRLGLIADDISVVDTGSDFNFESNSSVIIKRATDYRFGVGYSQLVGRPVSGALIVGGKVNLHKMALGQKISVLSDGDSDDSLSMSYIFDRDYVDSGIGIDLGAIWAAPNYQLGATVANVNEPEFKFKKLGNCAGLSGSELNACNVAIELSKKDKLTLNETYKKKAQLTLDAAIMSVNQNWSLAGSFDVNSIAGPLGDKYQWSTVSISHFSDNILFPGIRVGYRKNHVGSQLSYITGGLTLSRRLNFDLAYGLETAGSTPRSVSFSLGYAFAF